VTGGSAFSAVLVADGGILAAGNGVMFARREALETSRGEVKICAGGEVFGLVVANVLLTSRELSSTDGNSIAKVFLSLHRPARAIRVRPEGDP